MQNIGEPLLASGEERLTQQARRGDRSLRCREPSPCSVASSDVQELVTVRIDPDTHVYVFEAELLQGFGEQLPCEIVDFRLGDAPPKVALQ